MSLFDGILHSIRSARVLLPQRSCVFSPNESSDSLTGGWAVLTVVAAAIVCF